MIKGVIFQAFEWHLPAQGTYYQKLKEQLDWLHSIGITSIWLPPLTKATSPFDVGYGVYDLYDLGEFDQKGTIATKYGTKAELHDMIARAHHLNLRIYADTVLNHKAGADTTEKFKVVEVNPDNRLEVISDPFDIEGWTSFKFPGRKNKYSAFKWNFNHFSGVDYDNLHHRNGVYKILGDNKDWSEGVSEEFGNYDFLMFADINHDHPDVKDELFRWVDWFVSETQVDGLRMDAIKHIDDIFIRDFVNHCYEKQGPDFYIVGEYWSAERDAENNYLQQTDYKIDLFDVALHYNFFQAANEQEHYDLRTIFDDTLTQNHPGLSVPFVENHDTQADQSLSSWIEDWFKPLAYALILMRQDGYPCVFYGDLYGIGGEDSIFQHDIVSLLNCRKLLLHGQQDDYFDDPTCIGWVIRGDKEHLSASATLLSNHQDNQKRMFVGKHNAHKTFVDWLHHREEEIIIDDEGYGEFLVYGHGVSVWAEKQL